MNLRINGEPVDIAEGLVSIEQFLRNREFSLERVVVEHNRNIVPREQWASVFLKEGDAVEIISFVGGG